MAASEDGNLNGAHQAKGRRGHDFRDTSGRPSWSRIRRAASIRWQLVGAFSVLILATVLFQVIYLPLTQSRRATTALEAKAASVAPLVAKDVRTGFEFDDREFVEESFEAALSDPDLSFLGLYSENGDEIVAVATGEAPTLGPLRAVSEATFEYRDDRLLLLHPVVANDGRTGLLVAGFSLERIRRQRGSDQLVAVLIGLATLIVGLTLAFIFSRRVSERLLKLSDVAKRVTRGDLQAVLDRDPFQDEIGELTTAIHHMLAYLKEMADVAEAMAGGDLSLRVEPRSEEDALGSAFGRMLDKLSQMIGEVQEGVATLSLASSQTSATAQHLSDGTSEQGALVEQTTTNLGEMNSLVSKSAEICRETEQAAMKGATDAERSGDAVRETTEAMTTIAEKIAIIEDIAFQTNILALNAAIEAAHSGEHGRGFAVVASEIRRLADGCDRAAKEIRDVASASVEVAGLSQRLLADLVPSIRETVKVVQELVSASEQQASGLSQIYQAMGQVDNVSQQGASAAQQLSATAHEMAQRASTLQKLMDFFNLGAQPDARVGVATGGRS